MSRGTNSTFVVYRDSLLAVKSQPRSQGLLGSARPPELEWMRGTGGSLGLWGTSRKRPCKRG